ncbi:MAG: CPBP family intramembrane glutamic endopeptidase [Acidobacteriota bacterium]
MNPIIFSLTFSGTALLVFLLFKWFDKRLLLGFGLLFAIYIGLDDLVTGLPSASKAFQLMSAGEWNWSGKIYSLVLSALVILALGIKTKTIGLTFTQKKLKVCLIALGLFILWGAFLGRMFSPEAPSAETLAFQGLMPGLSEEMVYRGIGPAILLGLIRGKDHPDGIPWTVVFITSIMFGIWHGLSYSDAKFSFEPLAALFPFIGSIAGGWLRFKSGSLIFPILGHCAANVAFHLSPMIGS